MTLDLKGMSKKQLEKLKKDVDKALAAHSNKEKKEARKAAEKAAAKFGFSLSDLTGGETAKPKKSNTRPKTAGVAKYANPNDKSQTWTGKGRRPDWFKAAVDAGADPSTLEI
ncbi:MAG: H-NS histone family protein [Pseudomonadota bacterium]